MEDSLIYGGDYKSPAYQFTASVKNLKSLPRFGHGSDITVVFSSDQDGQEDYAAGLIAIFVFLLMIFVFWTIAIFIFKVMGPANAGFLSGYRFVIPDPVDDVKGVYKRPRRVRIVFLIACALLMLFAFLFVGMGLTNVNNASTTMGNSLKTTEELLQNAKQISANLEKVGVTSMEIRDAAVTELDNLCPDNPNIGESVGMDIMGTAGQAQADLTMLADFIAEGTSTLNDNLALASEFTASARGATETVEWWGWRMKLLVSGLFILPAFLAVGVGLVMLDVDVKPYQNALTYFFMPLFGLTVVASYIVCCLILPASASSADVCSGGGEVQGGPDDTVLTVYRNLVGNDNELILQFVGFYTQQCRPEYHPFDFLSSYLNDLDTAIDSTADAVDAVQANKALLEAQCGRSFDGVVNVVNDMNANLKLLRQLADQSLDLIKCENINSLYVNTVHEAGCTYGVDAIAWMFACSLVISVCGLTIIMLRSSYYPCEYLEMGSDWITKPDQTKSLSVDENEAPAPASVHKRPQSIRVQQMNDNEYEMGHDF